MASRGKRDVRAPAGGDPGAGRHVAEVYERIYAVVRRIPRGRVATYGQVAELAGLPGAARVAGAALRASLPEAGLPWQRVVGRRSPTRAGVSIHDPVGAAIQRGLLEQEGVEFTAAGTISLAEHGWRPQVRRAAGRRAKRARR